MPSNQLPKIVYRRHSSYRKIAPSFEDLCETDELLENPLEVNLCDYWDNVDGLAFEAFKCWRTQQSLPLRRLSIFITDLCNLNCDYCQRKQKASQTININWLKRNANVARERGALFFDIMGLGEPTLINELPEVLKSATSLGMIATFGTNGATHNLADPNFLSRLFEASPLKVRISLDSADPEEHDSIRKGSPTWHKAVNFLNSMLKAREENNFQAGIFINKVLTASNERNLLRDLKFIAELGVDDIHLIPIRFCSDLYFSVNKIHRFNQEIAPQIKEIGEHYNLAWLRENAFLLGQSEEEIERASRGRYYKPTIARDCYVLKSQIVLDPNKQPYTCLWGRRAGGNPIFNVTDQEYEIGQIFDQAYLVNYLSVNPYICENYCTRRIIESNDRVARAMAKHIKQKKGGKCNGPT